VTMLFVLVTEPAVLCIMRTVFAMVVTMKGDLLVLVGCGRGRGRGRDGSVRLSFIATTFSALVGMARSLVATVVVGPG
jgi:hypothetical protein